MVNILRNKDSYGHLFVTPTKTRTKLGTNLTRN